MQEFINEAFTDFSNDLHANEMKRAIEEVRKQLGKSYVNYIGGQAITKDETFASINPSNKEELIGQFPKATTDDVTLAIEAASKHFETWSKTPASQRAQFLFDAATLMRKRKHWFSAWMMFETGKTWVEADADTAEAIDFMEFYAREMLRLSKGQELTKIPGEDNELSYRPLGVGAIIPPWNFPLAICVGMTTAALVCGNTVVLKPSSDSPTVAYHFVELMREVGLPEGVLNFVTGSGSQVGDHLVSHPKIRFISFTGSREVGLRVNELAAKTHPEQKWIKRLVAEMGGKDAIVVDEGTDVDEVSTGIVAAAFGFQGQKCSACSRAIIHESMYDQVVSAVIEKTKKITIGDPTDRQTQFGPVISSRAFEKIKEYIEIG
ncbi:MAG: aldehyde dehydrogenase family protein, partial [Bdellovibrionales bacterium]|nr:aldehyde dehydrogenase family protein [Bdellovibrionales bacterium]